MDGPVLLSLGHGYAAAALAASLPEGWRVVGTTRSAERAEALRRSGVEAVLWDDAVEVVRSIDAADRARRPDIAPRLAPLDGHAR